MEVVKVRFFDENLFSKDIVGFLMDNNFEFIQLAFDNPVTLYRIIPWKTVDKAWYCEMSNELIRPVDKSK